jgi:hypothetical protein
VSRVFLVCAVLLAACAGFLLGRSTGSGPTGRSDSQSGFLERQAERRLVSLPAEEVFELRAKGERVDLLRAENERLREELKRIAPATAEEELPPGSRREDQSIVGGARWSDNFTRLATGFLDAMIAEFIKEANLSPEQERRLMDELHVRVGQILAVTADFTNGDIDGDRAYEQLNILAEEGHKFVRGLLDDKQLETYFRFESGVKEFMQQQVVHNEMATLSAELNLDSEQARHIQALVEDRYGRAQERLSVTLPNVMFKLIRREADSDIYTETGKAIRQYLRPDQAAAFDRAEQKALSAPFLFRSMLVPKTE